MNRAELIRLPGDIRIIANSFLELRLKLIIYKDFLIRLIIGEIFKFKLTNYLKSIGASEEDLLNSEAILDFCRDYETLYPNSCTPFIEVCFYSDSRTRFERIILPYVQYGPVLIMNYEDDNLLSMELGTEIKNWIKRMNSFYDEKVS